MILDEPTASLDLSHQVRIMDLMRRLQRQKGMTVVMVSHDINLARMYADHILLLKDGHCQCEGTIREVLRKETLEMAYGCRLDVSNDGVGRLDHVLPLPADSIEGDR